MLGPYAASVRLIEFLVAAPHSPGMDDTRMLPRMTVLVVEDNPSVASLLQGGLERDGYSVDVAVDGNEALALGLERTYVAIVLDVMIPNPMAWPSPAGCGSAGHGCRS